MASLIAATTSAFAADYRDAPYRTRRAAAPAVVYTGIRPAPPLYYVNAPPHYVQDLRTGAPGEWVVPEPDLFERLFGPLRGYN
ncbi:MAG: hypothetical protein ABW213_11550 [Tardiphaga sp.]